MSKLKCHVKHLLTSQLIKFCLQYAIYVYIKKVVLVINSLPAKVGNFRDVGSNPDSGSFPGEGHGNPCQYSCLEDPMDREAWWATVYRVTQSWTQLK